MSTVTVRPGHLGLWALDYPVKVMMDQLARCRNLISTAVSLAQVVRQVLAAVSMFRTQRWKKLDIPGFVSFENFISWGFASVFVSPCVFNGC